MDQKIDLKKIAIGVAGIFLLMLLSSIFYIINPGQVGVVVRLGKISRESHDGLNFKIPIIESVVKMDIQILKRTATADAASKDLQSTHSKIAINYRLKKSFANQIVSNFGDMDSLGDRLLDPSIQESVKAITAQFTAEELITKRDMVSSGIKETLDSKLLPAGIEITGVSITNFRFSKEFDASVEEKNVAVQRALTAQRDLERIKIEAEQKVARAKAEAEALKLQKTEVTPAMVQLRAIEKWDGKLPTIVSGSTPFVDLKGFQK